MNDNFYYCTLHLHHLDPNPYPWPTPEKFRTTVAWPGGKPIFQEEVGPTDALEDAQGDGVRAEEDENMIDPIDYFIGGD